MGFCFYVSFCLFFIKFVEEVLFYKEGNGGLEWLRICLSLFREYVFGFEFDFVYRV